MYGICYAEPTYEEEKRVPPWGKEPVDIEEYFCHMVNPIVADFSGKVRTQM